MAGMTARQAAARLLTGVTDGKASLADQIGGGALERLSPGDRARAQRLALAALRNLGRADAELKPHLRKRPPAEVQAILRVAVAEMLGEGAAAHGVVSEAVSAVRALGRSGDRFAPMANAVLRRVGEGGGAIWARREADALPGWLRGRLQSAYGKKAVIAMEAAQAKGAPLDLTPKDGNEKALAERVGGVTLPTGSVRIAGSVQVSDLPGYAAGDWWVQDAAAALPARALAAAPGEHVLDLCAAPGGKTLQLAATGARVTALDLSEARMGRLSENLARCRLSAETVVADALAWAGGPFDAILLDAPCSATGTIRRHPDLPFVREASGLKEIAALQAAMVDHAVTLLKPGGRLVFATCSLLPEEGERQAKGAMDRHADLVADQEALALPGVDPDWIGPEGLRLRPDYWPDAGGMDGFFVAAFRRSGE